MYTHCIRLYIYIYIYEYIPQNRSQGVLSLTMDFLERKGLVADFISIPPSVLDAFRSCLVFSRIRCSFFLYPFSDGFKPF